MHLSPLSLPAFVGFAAAVAAQQLPLFSQEPTPKRDILTPEIDSFIESILTNWNSPGGVGIAVVKRDDEGAWSVETKGYGVAKADGSKVTKDTLFAIGSNSKLFDLVATGLLISNESISPRISWNTKIASLIPEWELADPIASSESTITDLMSHRTGLPRHDSVYYGEQTLSDLISKIKYLRPSAEFRETWQYNNIMYATISHIPEIITKTPFAQYVKKHIFLPLNLTSTTYSGDVAAKSGQLADGFGREGVNRTEDLFGMGTPRALPYWNSFGGEDGSVISGAGGVISSAKDVATWLQTLLLFGKNPANTSEQVIPSAVIEKLATGVMVQTGKAPYPELSPTVYGGAQMIASYRGHNFIEHGGATPGFHTQIIRLPFDNLGVAVLSNDDVFGALLMEVIKWRIIDEALGLDPVDWNSRFKDQVKEFFAKRRRNLIPRPAHPDLPPVPIGALEGKYKHPAYGVLEFCGLEHLDRDSTVRSIDTNTESISGSSSSCKDLVSELRTRLPGTLPDGWNTTTPTFFARMDKLWLSHVRVQHFSGTIFNVTGFKSLPTMNSTQLYWASETTEDSPTPITIEFVPNGTASVSGFGVTGGFWGAGPGVDGPGGDTVRDRAEVWFDRV